MLTNMILKLFLAHKLNKILRHVTFNFYIKKNSMKETRNLNIIFCQNGKSTRQKENNRHFQPVIGKIYCMKCDTILIKKNKS